jgi:hypothetical protein
MLQMCFVCSTNDWVFRGEAGVLLGNRKQSGDEMCMDLQAFISLTTQLQTCLLLFSSGDASFCHCPTQVKILRFFVKGK